MPTFVLMAIVIGTWDVIDHMCIAEGEMEISEVVNEFVRKGWRVTSQTEKAASLEKKASSRTLTLLLAVIPLYILIFQSMLLGIILLAGVLVVIAINNATKKSGTVHISQNAEGKITVSSNMRKFNQTYEPGFAGKIKA